MKNKFLSLSITLFVLIFSNGIQAQSLQKPVNQMELMRKLVGTWQANVGKDTVEIWEYQQYGRAFIVKVSQKINEKENPLYINNISFDSTDGRFKGFLLNYRGGMFTWIGSFTSEKMFMGAIVQNFNTETASVIIKNVFVSPTEWTSTQLDKNGTKLLEYKFTKVK